MNTTIDALGHRLELLLDGVHFRSDFEKALDSPEHLMAIGEHNLHEYEKIEAAGEERQERIRNLFANMLATMLQQEAIKQYGNTDRGSIHQVLHGWFNRPGDRVFEDRLRQNAKLAVLGFNLTKEQSDAVMCMFDKLPQLITEALEEIIDPTRFLPRAEGQSIVMALVDIMKEEVNNADNQRHN